MKQGSDRRTKLQATAAAAILMMVPLLARGAVLLDPELPGTTAYDGWEELTTANHPGYPSFPGSDPWPTPIAPDDPASDGGAELDKLAGNGFPASASIYAPFVVSTFGIADASALPGLETVVFQIDIGGGDDDLDGPPEIETDDGTILEPSSSRVVSSRQEGEFGGAPVTITHRLFVFDLTGVTPPIASFEVRYFTGAHSQTYALQLDQGDEFVPVPEPGQAALVAVGAAVAVCARRRRTRRGRFDESPRAVNSV